ncbi:MAG: hypothetical protein ACLTEP_07645 [Collinsella sp.]
MEGKRNRGEVTAELSEKVWARLCRENALVASEVWVDDARRVDFVAYRPHRPRDRSSNHATAAVVGAFRQLGPEEAAERDRIRAQAAARVQEAERHRREAECLFEYRFSCSPYSAMAYEAFHPELCERRVSKRRKQELVVYRLPDGSEPSGYAEMSVPADYADSSHVVPSVFISGTGGDRAWRDIDFDEAERKFAAAARRAAAFREGRPKLMQDEARRAAIRETRHRVCTAPILKSIKEIHR